MAIVPILFEDHLVPSFRPLSWTTPVFELRCGLFNTRERVELGLNRSGPGPRNNELWGGLLGRRMMSGLHTSSHWAVDPAIMEATLFGSGDRVLWLNGRLAPRFDILDRLLGDLESTPDFAWFDGHGLLAASLTGEQSVRVLESWVAWEKGAAKSGAWVKPGLKPDPWLIPDVIPGKGNSDLGDGYSLWGGNESLKSAARGWIDDPKPVTLDWIWEVVPATPGAILGDLEAGLKSGQGPNPWIRSPFGIVPSAENENPVWAHPMELTSGLVPAGVVVSDPSAFWTGPDVRLASSLAVDTSAGPVILDRGVDVEPHVYLEGPLYLGPGSIVKAGARIYGDSSFGVGCRLAGEIAESTFGDFANKQHSGFIGHAVLGSWINLGALTTCSDLKNNYGNIRVDLGDGPVDTGLRFVGLMMGDHAKTAIGTLFNTGTSVGLASNLFGAGMPPKLVGNFSWGGQAGGPAYAVDKALETAATVMGRRGCEMVESHRELFMALAG